MKLKVLVALVVLLVVDKLSASDYEVTLEKVEPALGAEDRLLRIGTLRVKKFNRTAYVLDGTYEVLESIDDTYNLTGTALNYQGNQYKKLGDKSVSNLCTVGYNETFREYFEDFQRHQKFPVPWKSCPYPTGPNEVSNYMIKDYANLLPDYIPGSEKWKLEARYFLGDKCIGGFNVYVMVRNHKSLMMGGK